MNLQANPPTEIDEAELLMRFVLRRQWIRRNGTVKQDAFIPPSDLELSVTRHIGLSDDDICLLFVARAPRP
jgi:hypothetical protein